MKTRSATQRTRPPTHRTLYIHRITTAPQRTTSQWPLPPPLLLTWRTFNVAYYRCRSSLISFADELMIRSTRGWWRGTDWTQVLQSWRQVPHREFDSRVRATGLKMLDGTRCCFFS
ncbi:hypothetical protein BDN67DRAFT_599675 [Paxillus ammoniavirescens]|nr:hypothetical protein BDN67DRAFT_599675 [Paxillus ammoniavirescens]